VKRDLYLGIDTGGTAMKFVLTTAGGEVVATGSEPTRPDDALASLHGVVRAVGAQGPRLAAVGLACAGIVDPESGRLGRSPNLPGWENTPLAERLVSVFGDLPVAVVNDVNGALYGEYCHGAGCGANNLVMLALGTGVGGGVMIGGQLVVGRHCGAGEIGHMVLDLDGPLCACGGHGCLEAYAGSRGILQEVRRQKTETGLSRLVQKCGDTLSTADVAALAEAGDAGARAVFAEVGRRLGQAIGNLVNILDPDLVIIGGGVAQAGDLIFGPCRELVPRLVLSTEAQKVAVVPAQLGNTAAAVGAASLARDKEMSG